MSDIYVDVALRLNAREVFTAAEAPAAANEQERTLQARNFAHSTTLNDGTTPAVDSPPVAYTLTIAGGGTTLDLTAIAGLALPAGATRTLDLTGKKVVGFLFRAGTANVAAVNIAPGASNPYPLFGTANDFDLPKGMALCMIHRSVASQLPAVSGTVKEIDIAGTNGDTLDIELIFGT